MFWMVPHGASHAYLGSDFVMSRNSSLAYQIGRLEFSALLAIIDNNRFEAMQVLMEGSVQILELQPSSVKARYVPSRSVERAWGD